MGAKRSLIENCDPNILFFVKKKIINKKMLVVDYNGGMVLLSVMAIMLELSRA